MKKKIWTVLLLTALLAQSGCGAGTETQNAASGQEAGEDQDKDRNNEQNKEQDGDQKEALSEDENEDPEAEGLFASQIGAEPAGQQSYPFYEDRGIVISLHLGAEVESGRNVAVISLDNQTDAEWSVNITGVVVNETWEEAEGMTLYTDPGEFDYGEESGLSKLLIRCGEAPKTMTISYRIMDDSYRTVEENTADIAIEGNPFATELSLPYRGFLGGQQLLLETDEIRATLVTFGVFAGNSSSTRSMSGIVKFENLSDKKQPVAVTEASVNGLSVEVTGDRRYLPAKKTVYQSFSISFNTLDDVLDAGEAIYEMSLLVLTDEADNSGIMAMQGGQWYDLENAASGASSDGAAQENAATFELGELLYEADGLQIGLVSQTDPEKQYDKYRYYWNLGVINGSDENVEIRVTDVVIDGIVCQEHDYDHDYLSVEQNRVGAHKNGKPILTIYYQEEGEKRRPEIRFKFHIQRSGGDKILWESEEITILPE